MARRQQSSKNNSQPLPGDMILFNGRIKHYDQLIAIFISEKMYLVFDERGVTTQYFGPLKFEPSHDLIIQRLPPF